MRGGRRGYIQLVLALVLLCLWFTMGDEQNPKLLEDGQSSKQLDSKLRKNLVERRRVRRITEGFERLRAVLPKSSVRLNRSDLIIHAMGRIIELQEEVERPLSPEFIDVNNITHLTPLKALQINPDIIENRIRQLMKTPENASLNEEIIGF